jgi:hypothetical protein
VPHHLIKKKARSESFAARFRLVLMSGRSKHAVHGIGEALRTFVAVRIVGRVHAAEAKSIQIGAVFRGQYVRCHHAHL